MALKPRLKWTDFAEYQEAFSGWTFVNVDFEELQLEAADFIYADPPYDVELTQYSQERFDWAEQERAAKGLSAHRGPLSWQSSDASHHQALQIAPVHAQIHGRSAPHQLHWR